MTENISLKKYLMSRVCKEQHLFECRVLYLVIYLMSSFIIPCVIAESKINKKKNENLTGLRLLNGVYTYSFSRQ